MIAPLALSPSFRTFAAPGTGRRVVQLTSGDGFAYPLYYFIPSITGDGRHLIHHWFAEGEVQLRRLDLATAESVPLTRGSAAEGDVHWRPWDMPAGRGVLDHRSVLNVPRNEVVYFDGNAVRIVHVGTRADRLWFTLPSDRVAIGQNCVTPDGAWFAYLTHDRATHERLFDGDYAANRARAVGGELRLRHFDTGEDRLLVRLNSPMHHVIPHGDDRFVFCHPANEDGMLLTDRRGGWYAHLRTQDDTGAVCHFVSTARGIAYEARRHAGPTSRDYVAGLYDPTTHARVEFPLPVHFGYTHTGADPAGKLWFFENHHRTGDTHDLHLLRRYDPTGRAHDWHPLTGNWPTYGSGQKSHFHPRLTPDRRWIVMVAGDPASRTNHIHLLDASDLPADSGVPSP